jgi:hypothetical protein
MNDLKFILNSLHKSFYYNKIMDSYEFIFSEKHFLVNYLFKLTNFFFLFSRIYHDYVLIGVLPQQQLR